MVLTVLEARVPTGGEAALQEAYAAAAAQMPAGLVRSELLRDTRDTSSWRIQSLWASRAALEAVRSAGTPRGVLIFRAAGAEPTLAIFEVVSTLQGTAT
jgi:heme-degrading monooxygenase HmoA